MSFSSNFIKKKNKRWHYFPFGKVIENASMPIKPGEKTNLENALDKEMAVASTTPFILVGLAALNKWLILTCLVLFPYLILKRRHTVRAHCEYIHYPFSVFLKNYFKVVYFYIDEKDEKNRIFLGISSPIFAAVSYGIYLESGSSLGIISMAIMSVLGFILFVVMTIKKRNTMNKENKSVQPANEAD